MSSLPSSPPSGEPIHPNNQALVPARDHQQNPIAAELVHQSETTPSSEPAAIPSDHWNETKASLVHPSPSTETDELLASGTFYLPERETETTLYQPQHWLEYLTTPWGVSGLALLLSANVMVIGAQLAPFRQGTIAQNSPESSTLQTVSENSSLTQGLNLAQNASDTFSVESLSIVSAQSPNPMVSLAENSTRPPSNLTDALLPPSLQPQPSATSYIMPSQVAPEKASPSASSVNLPAPTSPLPPPPPLPVPSAQVPVNLAPSLPPENPMVSQQQPPTWPSKPPTIELSGFSAKKTQPPTIEISGTPMDQSQPPRIEIYPPVPGTNTPEMSQEEKTRQMMLQQLKMEETNNSTVPLGFNHKTRLEMQNRSNQISPTQLPRQVKQLEHLQQRRVLDANN